MRCRVTSPSRPGLVLAVLLAVTCGEPTTPTAELMLAAATTTAAEPLPPEPVTSLLAAAVELAREDHPELDEAAVRAAIDDLGRRYELLVGEDAPPETRARAFATLLFGGSRPFRSVDDLESLQALHVDSVLARRAGYCLSLSLIALAVADRVGEPLHGIAMPNHFLVRWDDGQARFNLELTRAGAPISDAALRDSLGDAWHEDTIYMRNLGDSQVLGVLLHNRAYASLARGRFAAAERDLLRARSLVPDLPEVHRTLGLVHGEQGRWPAAIEAFERTLALYPGDVDALVNLALCRRASGDVAGAIEDAELAVLLDPRRDRPRQLLAEWRAGHAAHLLPPGARALDDPPTGLGAGLLGRYYRGTRFDREVARAVASDLDFDWKRGSPHRNVPRDRFSVRWSGWFKATETGVYTLFVVANDGVRIRFGDELAVDHWKDAGSTSWTGSGDVALVAGWHRLQIDYYDDSGNARLFIIIGREGREYPLDLEEHLFHEKP